MNTEAYIDNMIFKSKLSQWHLQDLRETFNTLRGYKMMPNLEKSAFRVKAATFLCFMIKRGE